MSSAANPLSTIHIAGFDACRRRRLRASPLLAARLTVALVVLAAGTAAAFPSGAPDSACKSLKPGHGGEPSSQPSPFELRQDKLQVEAGDQIKGKYCCFFSRLPSSSSVGRSLDWLADNPPVDFLAALLARDH